MGLKKGVTLFDESSDEESTIDIKQKLVKKPKLFIPKTLAYIVKSEKKSDEDQTFKDASFGKPQKESGAANNQVDHDKQDEREDYMSIVIQDDMESRRLKRPKHDDEIYTGKKYDEVQALKREQALKKSLFGEIHDKARMEEQHISQYRPQLLGNSKGLSIMQKMGFKVGQSLGKESGNSGARVEPIDVKVKINKVGIGASAEEIKTERGINEEDTANFRSRISNEKQEKLNEKIMNKMQRILFDLSNDCDRDYLNSNPMNFTVLWRSYIIQLQKDATLRESNSSIDGEEPSSNEISDAKISECKAFDGEDPSTRKVNYEARDEKSYCENDDTELLEFNELSLEEKVQRLHMHLRTEMNFCYYCGVRFNNQEDLFENCPGPRDIDHI